MLKRCSAFVAGQNGRRHRSKPSSPKLGSRLHCEVLEARRLLAYDLVQSIYGDTSGSPSADFGHAVAISEDYRVVGARFAGMGDTRYGGAVAVYDRFEELLFTLRVPDGEGNITLFGDAVAVDGDLVVVGAKGDLGAGPGRAYVFDMTSSTPTMPVLTLENPESIGLEQYGAAVAISDTKIVVGDFRDGQAYVYDFASETPTVPIASLLSPTLSQSRDFGYAVAIEGETVVVSELLDSAGGVSSAGSVHIYDMGDSTPSVPIDMPVLKIGNPNPFSSDYFGSSVSISGGRIAVGAAEDNTGATSAGSAYVFDLGAAEPGVPVHTINNPTPHSQDKFGISVALFGPTLVVGQMHSADNDLGGGAYVFDLAGPSPNIPQITLDNPRPSRSDEFGAAVGLSGGKVIVGSALESEGDVQGTAYVFDISGGPPASFAALDNPLLNTGDNFGISVSMSGSRIVVGATGEDDGDTNAGGALVYDLNSPAPTEPIVRFGNPLPNSSDNFGVSVSISGDLVVVGANLDDTDGASAGIAYVYDLSGVAPHLPILTLSNPTAATNDRFGQAVAISGTTVVVGAPGDGSSGVAYVYDVASSTPVIPIVTLLNPQPDFGDGFGHSVSIDGSIVVIGALNGDSGAEDAGSAHVYDLSSGMPIAPIANLENVLPAEDDGFGKSVSVSGNLVVVAKSGDDENAANAGSALVYDLSSNTPEIPIVSIFNPAPDVDDRFGNSVAIHGEIVVIGVEADDTTAVASGTAYVFDVGGAQPGVPVMALDNPNPGRGHNFGGHVAVDNTTIVVGAPHDNTRSYDQGAAYVFAEVLKPDFNQDSLVDCADINALTSIIAAGTHDATYDLTRDGLVTISDRDEWLALAGAINLPGGRPYLLGDADLDGAVDGQDFSIWNLNKFTSSSNWCDADFTANGVVDGHDLLVWNSTKFTDVGPSQRTHLAPRRITRSDASSIAWSAPISDVDSANDQNPLPVYEVSLFGQGRKSRRIESQTEIRSGSEHVADATWAKWLSSG